jgi:nucleoid-associated protein YgaU
VRRGRYFDLSTLIVLGLAALLFISLPGGCGESDQASDDDVEIETAEEATPPPMMDIVDAEPGVISPGQPSTDQSEDNQADGQPGSTGTDDAVDDEEVDTEPSQGETYVVQPGDTLYGIAVNFNVNVDALMEENGITDANTLQVGQILQIPSPDQ